MNNFDYRYLQQEIDKYFNMIKADCKAILHQSLMDTVFLYQPRVYNRTGQLEDINNIDFKIDGDRLYVYVNTDNLEYYSFGKGEGSDNSNLQRVSGEAVLHFLEVGHDTAGDYGRSLNSTSGYDYFHNYPSQNFLELAQERIKAKYPSLMVNVIRDQPKL
jgi:hypothetical protein